MENSPQKVRDMRLQLNQDMMVIEALRLMNPTSSKNTLRSWIEKKRVFVNGGLIQKANVMLKAGDEIVLGHRTIFLKQDVKILYEDKEIVVIEKPAGLLSVATDFETEITAHKILKRRFHSQQVYPVHRLDRETSGVMMFAYTQSAREFLKSKFEKHDIQREYVAVVEGHLQTKMGEWKSYLVEDAQYKMISKSDGLGKEAITHYEVIKQSKLYSTLKLTLETGRKNQIRVHCSDAGHPVLGDDKYGSGLNPFNRLALHAQKLGFEHPKTHKRLLFTSTPEGCFFTHRYQKEKP